jgi:hypothetical protein
MALFDNDPGLEIVTGFFFRCKNKHRDLIDLLAV